MGMPRYSRIDRISQGAGAGEANPQHGIMEFRTHFLLLNFLESG
jgi:hypothetical protein